MKRLIVTISVITLALWPIALLAQLGGQPVNQADGPPPQALEGIFDYAGTTNIVYVGYALSDQGERGISTISISAATNANPVSFTATAHGFDFQTSNGLTPAICIIGGTGNWTAINGCFTATVTDANDFTIPVNSTSFGALTGTISATTRCPLTTKPVWAIQKLYYNSSNLVIRKTWAACTPSSTGCTVPAPTGTLTAGNVAMTFTWAQRSTYAFQ